MEDSVKPERASPSNPINANAPNAEQPPIRFEQARIFDRDMPHSQSGVSFAHPSMRRLASMLSPFSAKVGHEPAVKTGTTFSQRLLRGVDAMSVRLGRTPRIAPHLATGLRGEEEAFFYLCRRGYTIIARRWKTPKVSGDVDLIGWDGDTLCFIEVKTRTGRDIVPAEFAVDQQKQKVLRAMAGIFRKRLPESTRQQTPIRFDVVSVYLPVSGANSKTEIELFQGAFSRHPR